MQRKFQELKLVSSSIFTNSINNDDFLVKLIKSQIRTYVQFFTRRTYISNISSIAKKIQGSIYLLYQVNGSLIIIAISYLNYREINFRYLFSKTSLYDYGKTIIYKKQWKSFNVLIVC